MLHGDPTWAMPDGAGMMEFSRQMYEEPEKLTPAVHWGVRRWRCGRSAWRSGYTGPPYPIQTAKRYDHSAIFVHPNVQPEPKDLPVTQWLLEEPLP